MNIAGQINEALKCSGLTTEEIQSLPYEKMEEIFCKHYGYEIEGDLVIKRSNVVFDI
jgi:hypothetical protein